MPAPSAIEDNLEYIKSPIQDQHADNSKVAGIVGEALKAVRERGDDAVRKYAAKFDNGSLDQFEVTPTERQQARDMLDPQTRPDTEFAIENVRCFAEA